MAAIIVFLLQGLSSIFSLVVSVGVLMLIVRAIISWAGPNPRNPIVQFLRNATDPYLDRIKALIRTEWWGLDFAPAIGITVLVFADRTVAYVISRIVDWLS
jgi:YggT family protein